MTAAVEIRDLFRVHSTPEGDAAALQGLSLAVEEREVVTVLGPSGSGKTSFLRILAGLDRPSAGIVRVFGRDVAKLDARNLSAYRTRTLGYADQHYARALAAELTARDLVALQLGLRGEPREARLRRADELLERVGLADKRDRRPAELSGGEQQRVAVCAALAHRPRLLLADEPTGELDAANADAVYRLIGDLARDEGCTTVIVSHDPESASIADRIVRIRDGRVAEEWAREGGVSDTIVVGRGGWLRLPEELLARAGIASHATASLEEGRIVVTATGLRAEAPAPVVPVDAAPEPPLPAWSPRCAWPREGVRREPGLRAARRRVRGRSPLCGHGSVGLGQDDAAADHRGARASRRRRRRPRRHSAGGARPHRAGGAAPPARGLRRPAAGARPVSLPPARTSSSRSPSAVSAPRERSSSSRRSASPTAPSSASRGSRPGERERVAIARAVVSRPRLLLADEPTSRLDGANAVAMAGLLARLAREHGRRGALRDARRARDRAGRRRAAARLDPPQIRRS